MNRLNALLITLIFIHFEHVNCYRNSPANTRHLDNMLYNCFVFAGNVLIVTNCAILKTTHVFFNAIFILCHIY